MKDASERAHAPGGAMRVWQRMLSGRRLDLATPSALDIEIEDIAHGLARVARWNGQTAGRHAFSVAQHSLLVEVIGRHYRRDLSPSDALALLLHDAPEYVIGDLISPFKALVGGRYREIEAGLQHAVHERFSLPPVLSTRLASLIKRADRVAAFYEATALAGFERREAGRFFGWPRAIDPDRAGVTALLEPMPARLAQRRFLRRFDILANR